MIDILKALFGGGSTGSGWGVGWSGGSDGGPAQDSTLDDRTVRLAACALLLELAHADKVFTESEQEHLEGTVRRQFGLDADEAAELIEQAGAERAGAVDLFQFTRHIDRHFSLAQKMVLAEAMWGLVYADGALGKQEDLLLRKISNLLRLEAGYLSQARNRARASADEEGDDG